MGTDISTGLAYGQCQNPSRRLFRTHLCCPWPGNISRMSNVCWCQFPAAAVQRRLLLCVVPRYLRRWRSLFLHILAVNQVPAQTGVYYVSMLPEGRRVIKSDPGGGLLPPNAPFRAAPLAVQCLWPFAGIPTLTLPFSILFSPAHSLPPDPLFLASPSSCYVACLPTQVVHSIVVGCTFAN